MAKALLAYEPVKWEVSDAQAIQMLERGECPPHLQKQALDFIINKVCVTYDQSYFGNSNDTIFREGRRFCGNTLVKMLKLNTKQMRSEDEPSETI